MEIASNLLKPKGNLVMKSFQGPQYPRLLNQMMQNGGFGGRGNMGAPAATNVQFDTAAARKTYDQIIAKYDKRYKKALEAPQYEVWKSLTATTLEAKSFLMMKKSIERISLSCKAKPL